MAKIAVLLALLAVAVPGGRAPAPAPAAPPAETLALTGAIVVDVAGGAASPATILIEGGRIAAVGPTTQVAVPSTAVKPTEPPERRAAPRELLRARLQIDPDGSITLNAWAWAIRGMA